MKTKELAEKLNLRVLTDGEDREVTGCYCGDLLSWVMSRAKSGDIWLTVMGNVNAIAVTTLADISAIVLTENATLDADAKTKAEMMGITIFATDKNTYQTAVEISELIR